MKPKKKDQPCKDVRKSKNKVSQERKRLDSAKIEINRDSGERKEKKKKEKRKGEKRRRCGNFFKKNMLIFMQRWVRLKMFIFLHAYDFTCV